MEKPNFKAFNVGLILNMQYKKPFPPKEEPGFLKVLQESVPTELSAAFMNNRDNRATTNTKPSFKAIG